MENNEGKDTQIQGMLRAEDKGISEASGILSRMLRIIMWERDTTPLSYSVLMRKWLEQLTDVNDVISERGNMNKEMYKPNMTFHSFIKALVFHRVKRFKIIIEAEWLDDNSVTVTEVDVPNPSDFIVRRNRTSNKTKKTRSRKTPPTE